MRMRGNTMEVTMPVASTTDFFVSVFISRKDNGFVVSDGGNLYAGEYGAMLPDNDRCFDRLLGSYMQHYAIKTVNTPDRNRKYYYATTTDISLIPSVVFDMGGFIGAMASAASIAAAREADKRAESFKSKANDYIRSTFEEKQYKLSMEIPELPDITLSAALYGNKGVTLLNYVTGNQFNAFSGNLCKSATTFQIITRNVPGMPINECIHLIDTDSIGFKDVKSRPYIDAITADKATNVLHWEDRGELLEIVA